MSQKFIKQQNTNPRSSACGKLRQGSLNYLFAANIVFTGGSRALIL